MKNNRLSFLGAALVAAALGAGPRALAQTAEPTVAEGADGDAARWLGAGNKAFKEGQFAAAEEAYRKAWQIKKGYDIAGNLGAAELAQGKLREAAQHLAFTLRMFPVTGEPALREEMQRAFDQCRAGVGAIRVSASQKGAQIVVDGVPFGEAPLADDVFVEPGEHVVEATLHGYKAASRRVRVEKGAPVEVALALAPLPRETVPIAPAPMAKRRSVIPAVVLGAVGVVGIGGGAALLGVSYGKRSEAEALREVLWKGNHSCVPNAANFDVARCPSLREKAVSSDTFHDIGVSAMIAGGVAAAGAVDRKSVV